MIKHEFKKLLRNRFFVFFLIVFLIGNAFCIYKREYSYIVKKEGKYWKQYNDDYIKVKGVITKDKLQYAKNLNPEMSLYGGSELYRKMVQALEYEGVTDEIATNADRNISVYNKLDEQEKVSENTYIKNSFKERKISEYYSNDGIDEYFTYDYSTAMVMVLILIAVITLVFNDKQIGMDRIVRTSKLGEAYIKGIRTTMIVTVGMVLMCLFRVMEYFVYNTIYQFDGLHMPLYSVYEYKNTLYMGTIGKYLLTDIGLKCIGILLLTLIAVVLAYLIKNHGMALISMVTVYVSFVILSLRNSEIYTPIKLLDGYVNVKSNNIVCWGNMCFTELDCTIAISLVLIGVLLLCIRQIKEK